MDFHAKHLFSLKTSNGSDLPVIETQITHKGITVPMAVAYEEVQSFIPRIAQIMLTATLVATDAFILICTQIPELGIGMWMFAASTVIFAAVILGFHFSGLRVTVTDDSVILKNLRKTEIPMSDIIDLKTGDIDIVRNYSGWGLKNVKFKNYVSHGYENGVSLKVKGMRVVTFTSANPEEVASRIRVGKE